MIARCRERGLGTMTWEIARHMAPVKVLVVARDDVDFVDESRFPNARWVKQPQRHNAMAAISDGLDDDDLDWLLTDVDVLYTAETPYDYRLFDMARRCGVGTAMHGMFEYLAHRSKADLPTPDLFLAPSPWRLREWPTPVTQLAVPYAEDRFTPRPSTAAPLTFVHPAGSPASGDRNGTRLLTQALPYIDSGIRIVFRSQHPMRNVRPARLRCEVVIEPAVDDYWRLFDGADAVILPRRYGGLCLPLQEASALGLPIVALTRERHAGYPHAAMVPCTERPLRLPAGNVGRADASPRMLAKAINRLASSTDASAAAAKASTDWAEEHTWRSLRPVWQHTLSRLAS